MEKKQNLKRGFLVIGALGMQGNIVARDLLERNKMVVLADLRKEGIEDMVSKHPNAVFKYVDLRNDKSVFDLIEKSNAKVVINCAERTWNISVYNACLKAKAHIIDLGSKVEMTKDQLEMSDSFRRENLTAITGCGSTPGINNVMLQYAQEFLDTIESVDAGFAWNSNIEEFVVPFSIQTLVEEFTEPAIVFENGKCAVKAPLDNVSEKEFREVGVVVNFLVHHPEVFTFFKNYSDKGLKNIHFYGGFPRSTYNATRDFISFGFAGKDEIIVDGKHVIPLHVLAQLLKNLHKPSGLEEKENLWVRAKGRKNNRSEEILMECIVKTLQDWESAGSNIDTGIPASIIARMVDDERISKRGSYAPEQVVPPSEFFKELRCYGILIYKNGEILN